MANFLLSSLGVYRRINHALVSVGFPLTGWSGCRQWPTCSEYAVDAIREHGAVSGMYRALARMLHCHPFRFTH